MKKTLIAVLITVCVAAAGVGVVVGVKTKGAGGANDAGLIEISGITFENGTYVYDGTKKTLTVGGEIPEGVTVTYENASAIDAGEYDATAVLKGDKYKTKKLSAKLTIEKAEIEGVVFESVSYKYDGTEKAIEIAGELPAGVSVEYENATQTEKGEYTARAVLSGKNYKTKELTATLTIGDRYIESAKNVVAALCSVPNMKSYMPQTFAEENRAVNSETNYEADFNSVNVIPTVGMGKQLAAAYGAFDKAQTAFSLVSKVQGVLSGITTAYQEFLNDGNEKNFEKTGSNYKFRLDIDDDGYYLLGKFYGANIELNYSKENKKCGGRLQIGKNNAMKYEADEKSLSFAANVSGVLMYELHLTRKENGELNGTFYEYAGAKGVSLIKSSGVLEVKSGYTTVMCNKRELLDLPIHASLEVYDNSTGKLIGGKVCEDIKAATYNTFWFPLKDVDGVRSIKVVNESNGTNPYTVYLNGATEAIHTKLWGVSGGLSKAASRRFDIELRSAVVYGKNESGETEQKTLKIPMIFVQEEHIDTFAEDFYEKNKAYGVSKNGLNIGKDKISFISQKFAASYAKYSEIISGSVYERVVDYIGAENEYFAA